MSGTGSDRSSAYGIYVETLALPSGVTAKISPLPGQIGAILKYNSGGTLYIQGFSNSFGSTYATSTQYLVGVSEVLSLDLSGDIYLIAGGTTTVCSLLRTMSGATLP